MPATKIVHIVDDEETIRRSLDFLLKTVGFKVFKWADGETFLKGIDSMEPACVLLDVRMPQMDGLEVQAVMAKRGINHPVIVLTGHGDISTAVQAMRAGAVDFLEKPFKRERLLEALEIGNMQIADRKDHLVREQWAKVQIAALTQREREVLDGLACGYPNKTIGYDLGISPRTVEVHRANVMAKLDVSSFAGVLRVAFAAGRGSEAEWLAEHPPQSRKFVADDSDG